MSKILYENKEKFSRPYQKVDFCNCLISTYQLNKNDLGFGTGRLAVFIDMLNAVAQKLPKGKFFDGFLNIRDFVMATKEGYEPFYDVVNSFYRKVPGLPEKPKWHIIFSMGTNDFYADKAIPSEPEWKNIGAKNYYIIPYCDEPHGYPVPYKWNERYDQAVFRGSTVGCGVSTRTNPRIHLAEKDKYIREIDAGIVQIKKREKFSRYIENRNEVITPNIGYFKNRISFKNYMDYSEQMKYKYVIHLSGNNNYVAYGRMYIELLSHFVILWVDDNNKGNHYTLTWYQQHMKPWVHYVPIKNDLSDLQENITWCIKNDKKAKKIADNAYNFGKKIFTREKMLKEIKDKLIR